MTLIPLFTWGVFPLLARRGVELTPLKKMTAGMFITALSFGAAAIVQTFVDRGGAPPSALWQLPQYVLLTVGEVLVSVTGLEFSYTQAPKAMRSTIMSLWFLTVALGNLLTAVLTRLVSLEGAAYFWLFAGAHARRRVRVPRGGEAVPAGGDRRADHRAGSLSCGRADSGCRGARLRCHRGDGHAALEDDATAGRGRDPRAGREDAGEVQGVRCRQLQPLALVGARAPGGAERVHRLRGRELLPAEADDEAAAADHAAGLERSVDADEIPPGRRARLAGEQIAEHDTVAAKVLMGEPLEG